MDERRFDEVVRALAARGTRRGALRGFFGAVMAATLATRSEAQAAGGGGGDGDKRRRRERRRDRRKERRADRRTDRCRRRQFGSPCGRVGDKRQCCNGFCCSRKAPICADLGGATFCVTSIGAGAAQRPSSAPIRRSLQRAGDEQRS